MDTYRYRVRRQGGDIVSGELEGADREAVVEALRREGLLVIEVSREERGLRRFGLGGLRERVGREDLVVFTRQLATMTEAGVPLVRSLGLLAEGSESANLARVLHRLKRDIESGASFSGALLRQESVFGRLYVQMVRAGEHGGALDEVLLRVAAQLEREQELRRQVRSAMVYPTFVLAFALLATLLMFVFVVPVFAGMYDDLGGELPLPTRLAIGVSDLLSSPVGLGAALCVGLAVWLLVRRTRTENGRNLLGRISLALPLGLGRLAGKVALARVARTLGSLVSAGVPILEAVEITAAASGNPVVEAALLRAREEVGRGESVAAALSGEPVFPHLVVRMVAVGEETGNLDGTLAKVADFYEAEVENAVRSLTAAVEPALIVAVGAIVGTTIITMYLPMFRVFELL
ncbi:Type II secretory pathway component PulF [Rubrobacter radiotolerans]|uniref:Type II secretion system F family protein n=1 Tax=Rubrobacter radiotolerans TaxID=42256 RepID=A0A023X3M1_RUBRA|nr:type II secretion system F family protein [Rubrobacter radiotolerans]AHY46649.1 Type II secretory pathway component PulF [Rubrobacter radiotolerans]MDX5894056.1 type II secretion system F family protein [Rubrobacter radiotolerans]SMC05080.1 type IV pilus assembly protein PilC [Rubrobacter radiotolerans DSM 5868]